MIVLIVGVIATGIVMNTTLRSVEKQLPGKLLAELNDLSLVLENLSDVVSNARIAKDMPNSDNLNLLRKKVEPVYNGIVKLRESYVIDNMVQASAFHAVVAPAIADLQIWLSEGVSGLGPENKTTAIIIFLRIYEAYQKARMLNLDSRIRAQTILEEQQKRLGHFLFNANLLFVLAIFITFGMVYLLIRQYILQLRESEAQSELRDQRDLLNSLFENVSMGITVWDQKGSLLFSNRSFTEITGYSKPDIKTSKDWFLKAYPDQKYRNQVLDEWKELAYKKETIHQFKVACKNNEVKDIEFRSAFLNDGRALVTMTDITWRIQAEKEKINAQKFAANQSKQALVGRVAGKMAHDFNNILGIIMGNTELALWDCKEEETRKTLELVFEQTIRGKNLTKNLVAFAKDQEPKQEFFRINEKIDLVINLLRKDLEGIEIIKEYKTGVPELLADPGMIEHAFVNLIQNSIHAISMNEYSRIIVRTYCSDENICFEVEDNGCGIPEEHLENIYEPSFTLKGTRDVTGSYKTGIKGTGYGMANIKKYIEQHKGNLSVESEFGSGTKFTIRLPVIKKELTKEEKTEIQNTKLQFKKDILIVEDEQAISDVQYRILTQDPCNHKVGIANTGQVAIDLFGRNKYDLISLDYILPGGINGMDVYNHIRETNKTIPILFLSGNIEFLESIKELKQKDANVDHLSKPCQNKDYVNSINKLIVESLV
ncbi:MAG: response regulator [Proteobacteria bacterium]|nr:response regulator [Pseudomonadota bacterium]MBU1696211.1 response regulator [Pseudomonadota bacterium]